MSTASPARIEANKRNAELSTGPKTPEGKAASRRNAFKHGLTGGGIVVPDEDAALIARIALDLHAEHRPTTPVGIAMIDRAAMLMVRLDRAGKHELALVADQVCDAVCEFDQFRRDHADDLFNEIGESPTAVAELERFPEGVDRLIEAWTSLAAIDAWSPEDLDPLARLSDAGSGDPAILRASIPGEIRRLEAIKAAIDRRPIDRARKQAADLALFSTSPEATMARKYEASTERAYHKAMKTFHEAEAPVPVFSPPEPPQLESPADPLGSFSPEPPIPSRPRPTARPAIAPIDPNPPVDRAKRPDPRKLRAAMDRKRR